MKKFDQEIVKIDKIVYGGQGLGTLPDGRKIFVWGALPSEIVRTEITKLKRSYGEGLVVEILEPSSLRIEPRDECYLSTSPWQTMTFDAEQNFKKQLVIDAFTQEKIKITAPDIVTNDKQYFYRNKTEYSLWWDNDTNKISLAFRRRGSHQKIPIKQSSIERPEIFAEARRIVDELNSRGEEARKYQLFLVRCNQKGEVSSALFENYKPHPVMKNLSDDILGQKYSYSPNGFFQINLPVYEMALSEIAKFINSDKVVDMYSGVGTIGLSVARDRDLTLVETNKSAYEEMLKNIPPNAKNITPICAKSEEALEYITDDITLIVDPPRAGLDDKVVGKILESLPQRVVYLSCNPATQARDTAKLLAKYKIINNQGFNFFPRTPHIENSIVLDPK